MNASIHLNLVNLAALRRLITTRHWQLLFHLNSIVPAGLLKLIPDAVRKRAFNGYDRWARVEEFELAFP